MINVYFQTNEIEELLEILYDFNKVIGTLVETKKTYKDHSVSLHMKIDWLENLMISILEEGQELKGGVLENCKELGYTP